MAVVILSLSDIDIDDIITAIEGILTSLGLKLEDLSAIDIGEKNWGSKSLAQLKYNEETFLDTNGQQSNEAIVNFIVTVKFRQDTPGASRDTAALWVHNLKHNITPANINDPNKLVIEVYNQTGRTVDYENSITTIEYNFDVRYKNED
jgi:hypothetical protein